MISVTDAQLNAWLAGFFLPLARILGLIMVAPGIGHSSIPVRVRVGLGFFIALAVMPTLPATGIAEIYSYQGMTSFIMQILIGIAMGLVMQLAFAAVGLAGDLVGLQMGIGFATFVDFDNPAGSTVVIQLFNWLALLIFFATNAHLALVATLADSFHALPIAAQPLSSGGMKALADGAAIVFQAGIQLALPIIAVLLLTNIVLAVLTRSAPQMNIFAIGFPITLGIGLVMIYLALPYYASQINSLFQNSIESTRSLLNALGAH